MAPELGTGHRYLKADQKYVSVRHVGGEGSLDKLSAAMFKPGKRLSKSVCAQVDELVDESSIAYNRNETNHHSNARKRSGVEANFVRDRLMEAHPGLVVNLPATTKGDQWLSAA